MSYILEEIQIPEDFVHFIILKLTLKNLLK